MSRRRDYSRRRVDELLANAHRSARTFAEAEAKGDLWLAARSLGPHWFLVFRLTYLWGYSGREICRMTGWRLETIERMRGRLPEAIYRLIARGREFHEPPRGKGPIPLGYACSWEGRWPAPIIESRGA